jgi:NAD(P)-dependent dehydrogenase (short-subunit alcohol dehydrogenase family)
VTEPDLGAVAIVTGGAGGIGSAVALRLAQRGCRVAVADLDRGAASAVAEAVGGMAVEVDVTDPESNRAMVAEVLARYGQLDVLVLNAGINSGIPAGEPLDLDRYRRAMAVNVDGVAFGLDAARAALSERGGAVVVMGSLAALWPSASNPVYTLGKSAIVGYARAMARPLGWVGVSVNAICPAFVDTPMLGDSRSFLVERDFPIISPDEVASAVATVLDSGRTGDAWVLVAGRPAEPYEFADIPATLRPDGSPVPPLELKSPPRAP